CGPWCRPALIRSSAASRSSPTSTNCPSASLPSSIAAGTRTICKACARYGASSAGRGGAAVLGLMPSPDPVQIGEHSYVGLLVPSAPVPFGGALIYVPTDWVKPADGGVERLMNVYVSMGVTPPESMPSITDARAKKAKSSTAKTPKSTG